MSMCVRGIILPMFLLFWNGTDRVVFFAFRFMLCSNLQLNLVISKTVKSLSKLARIKDSIRSVSNRLK